MDASENIKSSYVNDLIESIDQAIIVTDLEGKIVLWNKGATNLYQWKANEALGKSVIELLIPEISKDLGSRIFASLTKGEKWSGNFIVQDKDKNKIDAYVVNSPLYDNDELIGIVGISHDLNLVLEEKEASFTQIISEKMENNLSALISDMTHKFNNNLMITQANLELILNKNNSLKGREIEEMKTEITKSINMMNRLTRQMQVLTGKKSFKAQIVSLSDILWEVEELCETLSLAQIKFNIIKDSPEIIIDKGHLEQIIFGLIYNYDRQNGASIDGGDITIESGIGKPKIIENMDKNQKYVYLKLQLSMQFSIDIRKNFEKPFLSDMRNLSLIINSLKGLIDAYEGIIEFDNYDGSFLLYFPTASSKLKQNSDKSPNRVIQIPKKSKILIAEDNHILQKSLLRMIINIDLEPILVENGDEAIKKLQSEDGITLCLIDLKMPKIDGIEVAKYIDKCHPSLPYLLISGYHDNIDPIFEELRVIPKFLAKPFTQSQLEEKLKEFVIIE